MHNLPQPVRLWYWTPIFRYDRPQAGRYRQHHQFGVEAIGEAGAAIDAEVIELLWRLYDELGLTDLTLNLNSIGDSQLPPRIPRGPARLLQRQARPRLRRLPRALRAQPPAPPRLQAGALPADHRQRARHHRPPLRRLRRPLRDPPRPIWPQSASPSTSTRASYAASTTTPAPSSRSSPKIEGGQSTIGGGGRYDGLIELLGGRPTPGIGFGTGIERIILNMKRQGTTPPSADKPQVFVVSQTPDALVPAFRLASDPPRAGVSAIAGSGERSLKSQMRHADAIGAAYAAIIGERELKDGTVTLKRPRRWYSRDHRHWRRSRHVSASPLPASAIIARRAPVRGA